MSMILDCIQERRVERKEERAGEGGEESRAEGAAERAAEEYRGPFESRDSKCRIACTPVTDINIVHIRPGGKIKQEGVVYSWKTGGVKIKRKGNYH